MTWLKTEYQSQHDLIRGGRGSLTRIYKLADSLTSHWLIGKGQRRGLYIDGSGTADQALVVLGAKIGQLLAGDI